MSQKIIPFIRCTDNAQQVAQYYTTIFPGSKITVSNPVVTNVEIFGQTLATLNGGTHPEGVLNPSISFSLWIKDKTLTQNIRNQLSDGGQVLMDFASYPRSEAYGRCNDKYGVSRQVMYVDRPDATNMIIPSLMFVGAQAGKAQQAINMYTKLFPESTIGILSKYGDQPDPQDNPEFIAHGEFTLMDQQFIALDSSADHRFNFNDGVSLLIACEDQAQIDYYRNALTADGGQEVQCGWCKDKYGLSRQVFPLQLQSLITDPDPAKSQRAMQAMFQMKKIDMAGIQKAYEG